MKNTPALLAVVVCAGCVGTISGDPDVDGTLLVAEPDDLATTSAQLSGSVPIGSTLQTTGNLNLRSGPGTTHSIRLVIPSGGKVTTVETTTPTNGFYNVKYNGTVGWSSGNYLKLVTSGPVATASINDKTRGGAVVRAKSGVGGSYWWGNARWYPFNMGGDNRASDCKGSCPPPGCSHTGATGADCSGYVAKLWQVPSTNDALLENSHPYGTIHFVKDTAQWHSVSRGSALQSDALVYNSGGGGHIFLYDSGDSWGWMNAYEAKGCEPGIVHNLRTASSSYHVIRHY